jgi:hypothetical protein
LERRFEETLLICNHGLCGRVLVPQRRAATATIHPRKNSLFLSFSKLFWNFAAFFL